MDPAHQRCEPRANGLTYNRLIQGLGLAGIEVDRRMLADLAVNEPATFAALVATAKAALPERTPRHAVRRPRSPAPTRHRPSCACLITRARPAFGRSRSSPSGRPAPETGLFLLEGPQAVREALAFRPELVVELYATPTALERHTDIAGCRAWTPASTSSSSPNRCSTRWPTPSPRRGSSRSRHQFPTSVKDILSTSRSRWPRLLAILEEVRDPGNAGTIIRAADAAGADGVIFTGRSVDLYNPKVVRASTGSLFHLPVAVGVRAWPPVLERARAAGLQVLAADIKGEDLLPRGSDGTLAEPTAWLFGNEARGLTDEHLALADRSDHGADLRPGGVHEPRHRGIRVPLRVRVRAPQHQLTTLRHPRR